MNFRDGEILICKSRIRDLDIKLSMLKIELPWYEIKIKEHPKNKFRVIGFNSCASKTLTS